MSTQYFSLKQIHEKQTNKNKNTAECNRKIQTFINKYLRRIVGIYWPNRIMELNKPMPLIS